MFIILGTELGKNNVKQYKILCVVQRVLTFDWLVLSFSFSIFEKNVT